MMIDFHSHILPGIDDGSQSPEESRQMLNALGWQDIDTVIATPHFYASQRTPEHFLHRRQQAWDRLRDKLPENSPRILLGAEVYYYPGISEMEQLPRLCIEGSDLLLLEMPFAVWSRPMVDELELMARSGDFQLILAHIERYYTAQRRAVWDTLLSRGVLMQSNASFFLSLPTRGRALRMLSDGRIHLLGSDCHNMDARKPRMREAFELIERRLGSEPLERIDALGRRLLSEP